MEKKQFDLVVQVLTRFEENNILDKIVLVGSWCIPLYKDYFAAVRYYTPIRTRDIDFMIPLRTKFAPGGSIPAMLRDLGFVMTVDSISDNMKLEHHEFSVEFLVPDIGRGLPSPYNIPSLNINAQPLRYLNLLTDKVITVKVGNIDVRVPHPALFALHKLIVSGRRTKPEKQEKDISDGLRIMKALIDIKDTGYLIEKYRSLPAKWKKEIIGVLKAEKQSAIMGLLSDK